MNSREKGKRGERLWRDVLREHGLIARRGQQHSGSPDSPDVICEQLQRIHFEVKFVEKLNIRRAMSQAEEDCGRKNPVVAHKIKRGEWLVTMKAEDFIEMAKRDTFRGEIVILQDGDVAIGKPMSVERIPG